VLRPSRIACLILDLQLSGHVEFELLDHLTAFIPGRRRSSLPHRKTERLRARAPWIPNSVYLRKPFTGQKTSLQGANHPNISAQPLDSLRGPTDGRFKLAFIEFSDQGSALDTPNELLHSE
jgi:hypothetical protein